MVFPLNLHPSAETFLVILIFGYQIEVDCSIYGKKPIIPADHMEVVFIPNFWLLNSIGKVLVLNMKVHKVGIELIVDKADFTDDQCVNVIVVNEGIDLPSEANDGCSKLGLVDYVLKNDNQKDSTVQFLLSSYGPLESWKCFDSSPVKVIEYQQTISSCR
ncbi:hypothetical protein L2E82_20147 [Cichorium intybus]|uniref:Uncharacterized protein n=1 Tax=Cichorium intybus TaxID=13427 RepID=A0ACB9DSS8_CICIN|nr:hypothetical protein L2E82_20147 [Cichorium intybus]